MKIALGTVQFGLSYGVVNRGGKVTIEDIERILQFAEKSNIDTIDTAIDYGDSERRLGDLGIGGWRVITKLGAVPNECGEVSDWIDNQFQKSIRRLGQKNIAGFMLHRPNQLLEPRGEEIWSAMQVLKDKGLVEKIGYSIYRPEELDLLWSDFLPDIIQFPYNILDQRIRKTGWLKKLHDNNVETHARSVFLQGLLLMTHEDQMKKFKNWANLWNKWEQWLSKNNLRALEACLGFVLSEGMIDYVVVGVDSVEQLKNIIEYANDISGVPSTDDLIINDLKLIEPFNWKIL